MTRARNSYRLASYWPTNNRDRMGAEEPAVRSTDEAERPRAVDVLRHGYTLADLHGLARLAVHTAGTMASNWHDRYDLAWSAIAEHLYTAEYWPPRHDLVRAGQLAILDAVRDDRHHHGYYKHKTIGTEAGAGSSPAFVTYWEALAHPSGSCETRVVERLSLAQILPSLTPGQREAIVALAVHEDWTAAAAALGLSSAAFRSQVSRGRQRFFDLWHQGEEPSRIWGCDRRAGSQAGSKRTGGTRNTMDAIRRRARAAA